MSKIEEKYWYLISHTVYAAMFGYLGKKSIVYKPIEIVGHRSIYIENDVYIAQYAWLMGSGNKERNLYIKAGTTIGHYAHIVARRSIVIEENVLIADHVFISDCTHRYEDIERPIKKQKVRIIKDVCVGEGSWIGENVCICGASIGRHSVIGANSVVTRDIPDYCVAVGSPANVVRRYDFGNNEWVSVKKH